MKYIIDSNVWIEYFNRKNFFDTVSDLLINNEVCINKIILAELIPSAKSKNENEFVEGLYGIELLRLNIDWDEIIEMQYYCIKNGINKLGLLDIAIAQNAKQNNTGIFTLDRNMILLCSLIEIECKNS
ncbi:MAG: PIN domain-containing protein [Clostridiales bacterium]|jgi:predicted nucleic acid-binding protein|nr:PIN domain-containing protein [Clostridiales bacterium]